MLKHFHPRHWRPEFIILVALALATRLWSLLAPKAIVFDEVYFKVFAGHYLDGHYFFDIHPPLAKLLLAGAAWINHLPVAEVLTGPAVTMRFLPAIAGALIIPVFWGILRRLGASRPWAFLGTAALLLDNALATESRFILIDSMLLLFGLTALWAYLVARGREGRGRWVWLMFAAIAAGAAASTKWTGLTALALVGFLWLADQRDWGKGWGRRLGELVLLLAVPFAIYASSFALHFALLPKSGEGDAFMSARFQQTLQGSPQYNPNTHMGFWAKFAELNGEMYRSNQTLTASHPYGSRWYSWPLELRPIYYWQGETLTDGRQGNIYLLGNPVVWWGIPAAILAGLLYAWRQRIRLRAATKAALALTGGAYLMNFVPFMGVPRVMFLYHYFFSFIFSLAFAVLLWNDLSADRAGHRQLASSRSRQIYGAVLGLIVLGFIVFAPLTYGTPLTPAELQLRMWLPSWR
jgi:dolichyl-phosphate-mannose-protein mannosyltransferase